jgi:hypothetical protein
LHVVREEFCNLAQKAFDSLEISELFSKDQLEVKKFLNRIFGIQLSLQREIFGAFLGVFAAASPSNPPLYASISVLTR